ncbi:unnamed protein product [Dovyalis caffra]|uniref:Uncharacterized protein n=1 Tax=Dovyalis caffra TaxID=77055 RepID=A0AAV1SD23_9ROSI|nr:unnamed protein product [Dovyalis caffra]
MEISNYPLVNETTDHKEEPSNKEDVLGFGLCWALLYDNQTKKLARQLVVSHAMARASCKMDKEKGESSEGDNVGTNVGTKKKMSQDRAEALKKCLEESKGDHNKCKSKIDAFQSSSASRKRPLLPLKLKSGSLTDV